VGPIVAALLLFLAIIIVAAVWYLYSDAFMRWVRDLGSRGRIPSDADVADVERLHHLTDHADDPGPEPPPERQ
jgi:hypothetical protein